MAHTTFPSDIPRPADDGAANHLTGMAMPSLTLSSTSGNLLDLSTLSGLSIVFCYPRTAAPAETVPAAWNAIPGARGCTPQNISFRESSAQLLQLGVSHIFGLSTQSTLYQQEVKERLALPFQLLSDEDLKFVTALNLPTLEWEGNKLTKRTTMAIEDGRVVKVFYPVFPPDKSAEEVVNWLKTEYHGRSELSTE